MSYLRNPDASLTNWEHVYDALPRKCGISDIDGMIERNGNFLVLESKRHNEKLSLGQEIMLKRLSKLSDFTVIIVIMDTKSGDVFGYSEIKNGFIKDTESIDTSSFCDKINTWFNRVD